MEIQQTTFFFLIALFFIGTASTKRGNNLKQSTYLERIAKSHSFKAYVLAFEELQQVKQTVNLDLLLKAIDEIKNDYQDSPQGKLDY